MKFSPVILCVLPALAGAFAPGSLQVSFSPFFNSFHKMFKSSVSSEQFELRKAAKSSSGSAYKFEDPPLLTLFLFCPL
jgi:hypothetical protein